MDDFLIYSGYLILLLNLILYSYSFFRKGKANVFFVAYLAFAFLMQFSMEIMYFLRMKNQFVINIFFAGQMILLGLFYNSLLQIKNQKIFVQTTLAVSLLIFGFQLVLDPYQFVKLNLFEIILTSLLLVVYALIHLYNMLTDNKRYYYVSFGFVMYLLSSTVLFLVGNLSSGLSNDVKFLTWILNAFLILVLQFFILYEWIKSFSAKASLV